MALFDVDQLKAVHAAWSEASAVYSQAAGVLSDAQARRDRQASDAAYQQALDAHDDWARPQPGTVPPGRSHAGLDLRDTAPALVGSPPGYRSGDCQ